MHRAFIRLAAVCLLAALPFAPAGAQSGAPHAWLFGAWTGGLFPVSAGMTAQACLGQPSVIFMRDIVMRAQLTEPLYVQRIIATARTASGQTDIQFSPAVDPLTATSNGLLGLDPPKGAPGFGCESEDVLHVQRRSENEIVFVGCKAFPNPLLRCPAR